MENSLVLLLSNMKSHFDIKEREIKIVFLGIQGVPHTQLGMGWQSHQCSQAMWRHERKWAIVVVNTQQ